MLTSLLFDGQSTRLSRKHCSAAKPWQWRLDFIPKCLHTPMSIDIATSPVRAMISNEKVDAITHEVDRILSCRYAVQLKVRVPYAFESFKLTCR